MTTNRWLPVLGGVLMNLALGSLYAWSVFVLPLEQEFKWTRTETSWVYTIAVVSFALTFAASGSKLKPVAGTVALITAYALDMLGTAHGGEEATRGLLYVWLFVAIPARK